LPYPRSNARLKGNTMASANDWADAAVRDLPGLLGADEACKALRIARRKLNTLVADRRLRSVKHSEGGSARLLIPRAEIARYLRSMTSES
jgi:excisionase family DNA binding protein